MLAASPAAKGLFHRAISESGGSFAPPRTGMEGGQNVLTLALAEAGGKQFLVSLGVNDVKAARSLPPEKILGAVRESAGFWPTLDGNVIVGDQYVLYQAGRFNDTPVLIGTNSDEGAMFTPPAVKPADYEKQVRDGYGEKAGVILAANPYATDVEARKAAKNLLRDSVFAWPTWAWANLQSQKGTGGAFVYYFDHRNAMSPDGANHGSEITYVFRNLQNPVTPPTDEDKSLSELMSSYWVNFAKNGDPNGPGLPRWPAFKSSTPKVMHFTKLSGAQGDVPNLQQLQALDQYYAWRRAQAKNQADK
jgi:para-nitrobenzyl esterase